MIPIAIRWASLALVILFSSFAYSQSATLEQQRAVSETESFILREQLGREQQAREREQARRNRGMELRGDAEQSIDFSEVAGHCFPVRRIHLRGASKLMNAGARDALLDSAEEQCLTAANIKALVDKVSNWYQQRGYITSSAYLEEQDLSNGELSISVLEGQVGSIDIDPELMQLRTPKSAFPMQSGVLNLRDLEQGIDQLNRLQSRQHSLKLSPGERVGESRVEVNTVQRKSPLTMRLGVNNHGQRSTGRNRMSLMMAYDNPFSFAGYLQAYAQTDSHRGQSPASDSLSLHYDIPWGYWHLDLDASYSNYSSAVQGSVVSFTSSGRSRTQTVKLSRGLHRDAVNTVRAHAALSRRSAQNYIEGTKLDSSSRDYSSAESGLSYSRFINGGQFSVALAYRRGLNSFGADDELVGEFAPERDYDLTSLDTSIYKHIGSMGDARFAYSGRLHMQESQDRLPSHERISIGGNYTVRGYQEGSYSGQRGAYTRQELQLNLSGGDENWWGIFGRPMFILGLDVGRVKNQGEQWRSLTGIAISATFTQEKLRFAVDYGYGFGGQKFENDNGRSLLFSISYALI